MPMLAYMAVIWNDSIIMNVDQQSSNGEESFNRKIMRRVGVGLVGYSAFMGAVVLMGELNGAEEPPVTQETSSSSTASESDPGYPPLISLSILGVTTASGIALIRRSRRPTVTEAVPGNQETATPQVMPEQLPIDIAQAIDRKIQGIESVFEDDVSDFYHWPDQT